MRTLIYTGSIHPHWGVNLALKAVKKLRNKWKLRMIMVGPHEPRIIRKIMPLLSALGIEDNVEILRQVPYHELPAILAKGEVGLAPYPIDSPAQFLVPLKIKEYCAAGLPIVTINVGETGSFVNENNVGLATKDDVGAYAEAIDHLLADRDLYKSKASAAVETARKYDWNLLFQREWNEIKKICNLKARTING